MSNSPLVDYIHLSPNHSGRRTKPITKITPHHTAGVLSVQTIGRIFADPNRYASSNYGIDNTGAIAMYVEEANRAWTSGNEANDQQAVTIEVSNIAVGGQWPIGTIALAKLIDLCVDICQRNKIGRLNWTGGPDGNLTTHDMFQATTCPGPHLKSLMPYIASEVNKRLAGTGGGADPAKLYRVQVGAFAEQANAIGLRNKLRTEGYKDAFVVEPGSAQVPTPAPTPPPAPKPAPPRITTGSRVKIRQGARDWNGTLLIPEAYQKIYNVIEVNGSRAVIGIGSVVTAAYHVDNLYIV